jgi:hypothetical protein
VFNSMILLGKEIQQLTKKRKYKKKEAKGLDK